MPDMNESLKTALNGPGPQHKQAGQRGFQWTEGSDNAMHTKIVDKNGKPIDSFSDNRDVVSELKAVKEENQNIANALESVQNENKKILERLDGSFDMQLTGSIVEEKLLDNEEIEASGSARIDVDDVIAFKLIISFKEGGSDDFEITAYSRELNSGSRAYVLSPSRDKTYGASIGFWSDAYNAITQKMKFNISNKSDKDKKITLIMQRINDNVGNELQDTYY